MQNKSHSPPRSLSLPHHSTRRCLQHQHLLASTSSASGAEQALDGHAGGSCYDISPSVWLEFGCYPPAHLPPPARLPPPRPQPKRKTAGDLRVHVSHAALNVAADGLASSLRTYLLRVSLGQQQRKVVAIKDARKPRFKWTVSFPAPHVLVATAGSLLIEMTDGDSFKPIGRAELPLMSQRDGLADGKRVQCVVPLEVAASAAEGFDSTRYQPSVSLWLEWECTEASERSIPPPLKQRQQSGDDTPLLANEDLPAEMTAPPAPTLMLSLLIGVPCACGLLAQDAGYSASAIAVAFLMPITGIIAFLITPITPIEDPSEPPFPTLENVLPARVHSVVRMPMDAAFAAKDCVVANTVGRLAQLAGPLLAPHMVHIAFGIQIYMGLSSLVSAEQGMQHVQRLSAGFLIFVTTAIQLPDSMAWAFTSFPALQRAIDGFNSRKGQVEGAVVNAADEFMQQAQEVHTD